MCFPRCQVLRLIFSFYFNLLLPNNSISIFSPNERNSTSEKIFHKQSWQYCLRILCSALIEYCVHLGIAPQWNQSKITVPAAPQFPLQLLPCSKGKTFIFHIFYQCFSSVPAILHSFIPQCRRRWFIRSPTLSSSVFITFSVFTSSLNEGGKRRWQSLLKVSQHQTTKLTFGSFIHAKHSFQPSIHRLSIIFYATPCVCAQTRGNDFYI